MKGKIILLIASSMSLGCIAALANEKPDLIIVNYEKKLDLKTPVISYELTATDVSPMLYEYQETKVEGDEWDSVTILYDDAVLPGQKDPVLPVSHGPPKA